MDVPTQNKLPDEVDGLKQIITDLQQTLQCKEQVIDRLQTLLERFKQHRYGPRSEECPDQTELQFFNEAELLAQESQDTVEGEENADTTPVAAHSRTRNKKSRALPAHLQRIDVIRTKKGKKGEVLERAPISSFPSSQRSIINTTDVFEHYFVIGDEYQKSKHTPGYIVYGLTSIVNHSHNPNAFVEWHKKDNEGWVVLLLLQDLDEGEEITIAYSNIDEYKGTKQWVA